MRLTSEIERQYYLSYVSKAHKGHVRKENMREKKACDKSQERAKKKLFSHKSFSDINNSAGFGESSTF